MYESMTSGEQIAAQLRKDAARSRDLVAAWQLDKEINPLPKFTWSLEKPVAAPLQEDEHQ